MSLSLRRIAVTGFKISRTSSSFLHSICLSAGFRVAASQIQRPSSSMTSTSALTASGVDIESTNGKRLHFVWVPEVNSTQNEMKTLLASEKYRDIQGSFDVIALGAASQTKGRGTSGRTWVGLGGNVFLTLAIPSNSLPFPITLLPLRIGTLLAKEIVKVIPEAEGRVTLKWPNDVLIGEEKVSGLLIEMDGADRFLLGIGVNIAQAPEVSTIGADRGRKATCLARHGMKVTEESAMELSLAIAKSITEWIGDREMDSAEKVLKEWSNLTVWHREHRLRSDGSVVIPLGLEDDGRLRVQDVATGQIRYLIAEYLL